MKQRILVAVVGVPALLAILCVAPAWATALLLVVLCAVGGYELLALSFDGSQPSFTASAKQETIENPELTVYYDLQCPYVPQQINILKTYCMENNIPASFLQVDSLKKAKELPCVFNNFAVFYRGKFETVNLLDSGSLKRLLKK